MNVNPRINGLSQSTKRNIAILAVKALAVAEPIIGFCFFYFGLIWMAPYWGYEDHARLVAASVASVIIAVNLGEFIPKIRLALLYPFARSIRPKD